ncbi:ATP-binding protein [Streptomyces sp. NPDC094049]|uniref:ATP-binding protein n=1 Tax=Streptomyces sp. NPDC094049 TaxID=3154987 RepID=UPI003316BB31
MLLFANSDKVLVIVQPRIKAVVTMALSWQRRFPRARSSVPAARAFALEALAQWEVTDRREEIRLCVSELATNALTHGVPAGRAFSLRLVRDELTVRIEVRDSGGGHPRVVWAGTDDDGGRGLRLVTALADDFGVDEHVVGKTVWSSFKVASALDARPGESPGLSEVPELPDAEADLTSRKEFQGHVVQAQH